MPHVVATALINQLTDDPDRNIAAALAAGSWRDMTRVALTDGSLVVNSSQGGGTKDTWVLHTRQGGGK